MEDPNKDWDFSSEKDDGQGEVTGPGAVKHGRMTAEEAGIDVEPPAKTEEGDDK